MNKCLLSSLLVATALGAAAPAHAYECFVMFDAKNTRVLETATAPIDLSKSISTQMAARYPSRFLVITDNGSCSEVDAATTISAAGVLALRSEADFAGTSPAPAQVAPSTSDVQSTRPIARGRR